MNLIENYIRYSSQKSRKDENMFNIYGNVKLYVLSELPRYVNLHYIVNFIRDNIPFKFFHGVDGIYISELPEFKERDINAIFKDGAIYVTGQQDSDEDLLDDIVHELGHAVEEIFPNTIYSDNSIKREFLNKRVQFYNRLEEDMITRKQYDNFISPDYSQELDLFFYEHLGYDTIEEIGGDLFLSPYAITSIREYWAVGFETYYLEDKYRVQQMSPALFDKINEILNE